MSTYDAAKAEVRFPAPSASVQGDVKANRGFIDLAVTGALAINDIVNLAKLPAKHLPVDCIIDTDAVDTGSAVVLNFEIYDPVGDDSYAINTGSIVGRAGGIDRMDELAALRMPIIDNDCYLRAVVATGPTTGATTGKLAATLMYRGAEVLDR
jgi:hypothetical protein